MTSAEIALSKFNDVFGDAIALHWARGDRDRIVKLLQRARGLLQDYRDELLPGRTPAENTTTRCGWSVFVYLKTGTGIITDGGETALIAIPDRPGAAIR